MNCPQRWKIKNFLSVGWESEKIFFFQIQCQVYRNDPRQILYNFDFFVQELQFFSIFDELSTVMKSKKNSKCQVRKWKNFFFQIQCQVYRNDPSQILYNFDFFLRELQIFSFFDELSTEMKN